ncbi:MAG: hypothetical protein AAF916_11665 [Planctomycetota bacterium]
MVRTLTYGRAKPRRWKLWLGLTLAVGLAVALWYRGPILSALSERYHAWNVARTFDAASNTTLTGLRYADQGPTTQPALVYVKGFRANDPRTPIDLDTLPLVSQAEAQDRWFKAMAAAERARPTRYRVEGLNWSEVRDEFADTAVLYVGDLGFGPEQQRANSASVSHTRRRLYRLVVTPLALHIEIIGMEQIDPNGKTLWSALPRGVVYQRWAIQRDNPTQILAFNAATVDPSKPGRMTVPYTLDGVPGHLQLPINDTVEPYDDSAAANRPSADNGWLTLSRSFEFGIWHLGSSDVELVDTGTFIGEWPVPRDVNAIALGFDDAPVLGLYDYETHEDRLGRIMRLRAIRPGDEEELLDVRTIWESPAGPPNMGSPAGRFITHVSPTQIVIGKAEHFTQMTAELIETNGPFVFAPPDVKLTDGRTHLVRDRSGRTMFYEHDGRVIPVDFDALPLPPSPRMPVDFRNGHVAAIDVDRSSVTVSDVRRGTSRTISTQELLGTMPTRPTRVPQLRISPDGKHLAVFIADSSVGPPMNPRLIIVHLDDWSTRELPMVQAELELHAWSGDGRRLLVSGGGEFYLFDITTKTLNRLPYVPITPLTSQYRHAISHDGRHVASLVREAGRRQRVVWWTVP